MSEHPTNFQGSITDAIQAAVESAIPGAVVRATGGGGHYNVEVVSSAFEGKNTLARHRMVLTAIAPLMAGDMAPVHAVDSLVTETPR
jgi:stress-induced morphogen